MKVLIEKHPLSNNFMCIATNTILPPFFGTEKQCKKARVNLCNKLFDYCKDYLKTNKVDKNIVLEMLEFINTSFDVIVNEISLIELIEWKGYNVKYYIDEYGLSCKYELI